MDKCFLCKSKERDDIKYGEFLSHGDISVHYFCLLLTSNLMQRGSDDEGFLGFLQADIKAEAERVASAVCCYCKKKSSNISCCARKCRKTFHLTCGVKNDAENQFVGTFKSYCDRHVTGKKSRRPSPKETCCICYEDIIGERKKFSCVTMLRAPCCKNGWFHKWCLAAFAKSAGYFFKCPLCNDSKAFRQRLVYKGIFIPDRDAAWELEPNAFADLLERPKECSAKDCNAKGGRTSCTSRNKLLFCGTCGSAAVHRKCMRTRADIFYCDECTPVITAANTAHIVNIANQMNSDEEEDIDVCAEDCNEPASSNSRIGDSGEDEEIIHPLRRVKRKGFRISDDQMSDDGAVDVEDEAAIERVHKRAQRILSSDIDTNMPLSGQRNHLASRVVESFFDIGIESDRSDSCEGKFNIKAATANCISLVPPKNLINHNLRQVENTNEIKNGDMKCSSLYDSPNENVCTTRTRRQSMCLAEIHSRSLKTKKDVKRRPSLLRQKSTFTSISLLNNAPKSEKVGEQHSASMAINDFHSKAKTLILPKSLDVGGTSFSSEIPADNGSPNVSFIAHRTHRGSLHLEAKSSVRPRSNSEDPSTSSPALQRTRRRSFLRSPYSTPSLQGYRTGSSTQILTLATNKRSRSNSTSGNVPTYSKRYKKNSMSVENENDYRVVDMIHEKRPSRGRSPLSSNLCSLYAFITPAYVRKNEPCKGDSPSVMSCPNEAITPEVGHIFSKGDSGYPLEPWILTPFRTAVDNSTESHFNEQFSKARSTVERVFGILKGRFRCLLAARELHYAAEKVVQILNVCCALHNICIEHNVELPTDIPIETQVEPSYIVDQGEISTDNNLSNIAQAIREQIKNNLIT